MDNQQPFTFDKDFPTVTEERMHARNTDPPTSHEMMKLVDSKTTKARVYKVIHSFGDKGCIMSQILKAIPEWGYGRITPTFAVLIRAGFIFDSGEVRESPETGHKQRVLVAHVFK